VRQKLSILMPINVSIWGLKLCMVTNLKKYQNFVKENILHNVKYGSHEVSFSFTFDNGK
jgi:hypothetical protein